MQNYNYNVVEAINNPQKPIAPKTQDDVIKELRDALAHTQKMMDSMYPTIPAPANETISEPMVYTENATLDLSGKSISASGEDGAIWIKEGAQLVINGSGAVHATLGPGNYSMAVWAEGEGACVIINDGYFTNETDGSERGTDLIYASKGAKITINGGTFQAATPQWTLNCKDNTESCITVRGGRFYKFDPSNAQVGNNEVLIPEGYEVRMAGDWYVVCKCMK